MTNKTADAHIERHNGNWYMIIGDEASPIEGATAMVLTAKAARMVEARRIADTPIPARVHQEGQTA